MRSLPTGRFVRVHSVRKNKNGTVDVVMTGPPGAKKKNPKKRKTKKKAARRKRASNPTYSVYEKLGRGYDWRQISEVEAKSGKAAIRIVRRSQRERGNLPPSGTKFKASKN
jgi:hypothetical protein